MLDNRHYRQQRIDDMQARYDYEQGRFNFDTTNIVNSPDRSETQNRAAEHAQDVDLLIWSVQISLDDSALRRLKK